MIIGKRNIVKELEEFVLFHCNGCGKIVAQIKNIRLPSLKIKAIEQKTLHFFCTCTRECQTLVRQEHAPILEFSREDSLPVLRSGIQAV